MLWHSFIQLSELLVYHGWQEGTCATAAHLSHCISLWHGDLDLPCSGTCSVVVALLQARGILEKYLLGSWGKSLHHSEEVHLSVGVLIRRLFHDKHDTKIQAWL